jgi:predicted nuclease of predicted toxin-antitoxin system
VHRGTPPLPDADEAAGVIQFLIDECLSPALLEVAREHGCNAYHVTQRGWAAFSDAQLLAHMLDQDLSLVTNNWKDFRPMVGRTELHPRIIAILPNVRRERQVVLFTAALAEIRSHDPPLDLVNTVLEVDADAQVTRHTLPPLD